MCVSVINEHTHIGIYNISYDEHEILTNKNSYICNNRLESSYIQQFVGYINDCRNCKCFI